MIKKKLRQGMEEHKNVALLREMTNWYVSQDLSIIPILKGSKTPKVEWTQYQKRKPTKQEVAEWFSQDVNVAVVCGAVSGNLVVIDFDKPDLFDKVFHGAKDTLMVKSSKGVHVYYKTEYPVKTKHLSHKGVPIDIQGEGAYVLCPPSLHPSGKTYQFKDNVQKEIATWRGDFDTDFFELLNKTVGFTHTKEKISVSELLKGGLKDGQGRDNAAIQLATWYRVKELTTEQTLEKLIEWNKKNVDPLTEDVLRIKVDSAFKRAEPYGYEFTEEEIFDEETMREAEKLSRKIDITPDIERALDTIVGETKLKVFLTILNAAKESGQVWGDTSTGKSAIVDEVMKLFPPETWFKITGVSQKAIRYLGDDIKTLYLAEFKAARDRTGEESLAEYDIKLSISEKGLDIITVEKDPDTGKFKTVKIRTSVENVITTSTDPELSEELRNRLWELATDESINVDVRDRTLTDREQPKWKRTNREKEQKVIRALMTDVLRNAPQDFVIPFATKLKVILTHDVPRLRRDTKKLLQAIGAVARLHYKTRPILEGPNGEKCVVCTPLDFVIAWRYGDAAIMGTFTGETDWFKRAMLNAFAILKANKVLDANTFAFMLPCAVNTANKWLNRLADSGILLKKSVTGLRGVGSRKYVYFAPSTTNESNVVRIKTSELVNATKAFLKKEQQLSVPPGEDGLSGELPSEVDCTLRTAKRRTVADLPDAEPEMEDLSHVAES